MTSDKPSLPVPWPEDQAISYEDYLDRSGDEWSEWVAGRVVTMTPVGERHQALLGFLFALLKLFAEKGGTGRVLTEPFQMKTGPDLPGRSPDILFVSSSHLGRLRKTHLEGPADLVIEIVSPESGKRDRHIKYAEYQQGGVLEYWILDPDLRRAEAFHLDRTGRFVPISIQADGSLHSVALKGLWFQVDWFWEGSQPLLMEVLREWGMV